MEKNTHNPLPKKVIHILSIDTSTKVCSVALHTDGQLVATLETYLENSHAENLGLMVEQVCKFSRVSLPEINAFAIAQGPGSYTGLRIGCSTAKGLCYALEKPLIALSTLRIMAEAVLPIVASNTIVVPMIDAKRMEVYCAAYNHLGIEFMKEQPLVVDNSSFEKLLASNDVLFLGSGAQKTSEVIQHGNARFYPHIAPLAKNMGGLGYSAYQKEQFVDVAYFEPDYLKEFYTTAKVIA